MVWGAFSLHGTSRLFIVEGNIDAAKYTEMVNSRLKPQNKEWFGGKPYIFQQDLAPCLLDIYSAVTATFFVSRLYVKIAAFC